MDATEDQELLVARRHKFARILRHRKAGAALHWWDLNGLVGASRNRAYIQGRALVSVRK